MRFDTPVYFRTETQGDYDASTGNYKEPTVVEVEKLASVNRTGIETMKLIYGEIKEGSLTIRLQNHYPDKFQNIRVGEKIYQVDRRIPLRVKDAFIVHEVQ